MKSRTWSEQLDDAKVRILRKALDRHEGNKTQAAWALRIDRNHLHRMCKKYEQEGRL